MKLIYKGIEINLNINECKVIDNIDDKADSLIISFADIQEQCRKWDFKKEDIIEIIDGNFSTGKMYVDNLLCTNGSYVIKAISLKKKSKTKKTRAWENIRFLDLAEDLTNEEGLILKTYGVENFLYKRVDQIERNNIDFLNFRCGLENYTLKISGDKALIISEDFLKTHINSIPISKNDMIGKYKFETTSNEIIGGCEIIYNSHSLIKGSYINNKFNGEILKIRDLQTYSNSEANRFAKNILKKHNKHETIGNFNIIKNTNIAAGSVINISRLNCFNGKYIVSNATHDLINNKSKLKVRKVLEYE